jgi:hypothetical protein
MFQSTVRAQQASGIVGQVFAENPTRAFPVILDSADAANNVIGRVFSHIATEDLKVEAGGTDFAGILVNTLIYANKGSAGDSLAPTLTLANEAVAECLDMGMIFVASASAAAINDNVYYNPLTGEIGTGAAPFGAYTEQVPNAKVVRQNTSGAGLCIIQLTN